MREEEGANALNQRLYYALKERFAEVRISNEGEAFVGNVIVGLDGRKKGQLVEAGEEYRVCCPYCRDRRFRLYVNHKWGTVNESGERFWDHLIYCFNEECDMSDFASELKPYVRNRPCLPPGSVGPREEPLVRTDWPGECVPLTKLPSSHPALGYLRGRRFDPLQLAELWDVRFCVHCPESPRFVNYLIQGRIVIPVYWDLELVGWQARAIDGSAPKYYTMPGFKKRHVLYNGQRAAKEKVGVLVEGVTDVWRLGVYGMGLLGKSVSFFQRRFLCESFRGKTLVNMLDPDALEDIERVHKQLKPEEFPGGYAIVGLPADTDPGGSETEFLYRQIRIQAGVELPCK